MRPECLDIIIANQANVPPERHIFLYSRTIILKLLVVWGGGGGGGGMGAHYVVGEINGKISFVQRHFNLFHFCLLISAFKPLFLI